AFGLVLIEALSGRTPFPGTTSETVAARLVRNPPLPDGLDQRWRELLSAMTSRDPAHRPAITEVASLLATLARPDEAARDPGPSGPTELAGDRGPAGAALAAPIADGAGAGDPVTEPVSLVHGRTRR